MQGGLKCEFPQRRASCALFVGANALCAVMCLVCLVAAWVGNNLELLNFPFFGGSIMNMNSELRA